MGKRAPNMRRRNLAVNIEASKKAWRVRKIRDRAMFEGRDYLAPHVSRVTRRQQGR
jgi:hypothetical protein